MCKAEAVPSLFSLLPWTVIGSYRWTQNTMEEAYATASSAVGRLISDRREEDKHLLASEVAVLRSVLQRRPVVLGFVVSTLARKLKEGKKGQPEKL